MRKSGQSWRRKDGNVKMRAKRKKGGTSEGDAPVADTRRKQTLETHPGSYAGELAAILSEERRQQLQERHEAEDAQQASKAALGDGEKEGVVGDSDQEGKGFTKKKVALLVSYWGQAYGGLQINEGTRSVESELELAIYLAGGMSKANFGTLRKVGWSRAGRTDKGVHAAAQVLALKLAYEVGKEKAMADAINQFLPQDIRVMDIKRTSKSFDARERCSGRRYDYMLPTFVLAPKEYVRSVFEEALKWERTLGNNNASATGVTKGEGDTDALRAGSVSERSGRGDDVKHVVHDIEREVNEAASNSEQGQSCEGVEGTACDMAAAAGSATAREKVELSSRDVLKRVAGVLSEYRLPPDRLETLERTWGQFVGTKKYHNYTNHKKPSDASCQRYLTCCTTSRPYRRGDAEWVRLTVTGQSFMMHQIRKMVAACVDCVRGHSSNEQLNSTFQGHRMNLGIAPSQGLYLDRPLYAFHNDFLKSQGQPERVLEWSVGPVAEALDDFKENTIQKGIEEGEKHGLNFVSWMDRFIRYPSTYQPTVIESQDVEGVEQEQAMETALVG